MKIIAITLVLAVLLSLSGFQLHVRIGRMRFWIGKKPR